MVWCHGIVGAPPEAPCAAVTLPCCTASSAPPDRMRDATSGEKELHNLLEG